jgi:hypothetical protein
MPYQEGLSMRIRFVLSVVAFALTFAFACAIKAATVNYSGVLTESPFPNGPLNDNFVIAGTFAPGFQVSQYKFAYGDPSGNLHNDHYARAVADGNFRPIGPGTLANSQGAFAGSGSTNGIDDLSIWIFMFEGQPNPSQGLFYLALVSGTGPTWKVQNDGSTNISTSTANIFVFGRAAGGGVVGLNVAPFPEPGSALLVSVAGAGLLRRKTRGA